MKHLTEQSLLLDPLDRLRDAVDNPFYVLGDFPGDIGEDVNAHYRHHWETTPVHEAGHAVATVLAGRQLRDVYVYMLPANGHLGMSRVVGPAKRELLDLFEEIGHHGVAREVVSTFAGPVAELRLDARLVFSGLKRDRESAEQLCKFAEFEGIGDRFEWHSTAWAEACRMFQNERVWAATVEIAERLKRSTAFRARVTGKKVTEIVTRHVPQGWDWQGIFKRPW